MNRLTGHEPQIYQCGNPKCGDILTGETLGEAPVNDRGDTEPFCTSCGSRNVELIEEATECG
jgi:hypothetical protein